MNSDLSRKLYKGKYLFFEFGNTGVGKLKLKG